MATPTELAPTPVQYHETSRGVVVPFRHYGTVTEGTRLILLHGLTGGAGDWDGFAELINAPVTGVGLPGPEYVPDVPTLLDFAIPVSETINHITDSAGESRRVDVLGLSHGGATAQQLDLLRGNLRKLILVATLPAAAPFAFLNIPKPRAALEVGREDADPAIVFAGDFRNDPTLATRLPVFTNRKTVDREHVIRQKIALASFGLVVTANAIRISHRPEGLFMGGSDDPLIRWKLARMGALMLGMDAHKIQNGGHAFLFTRPEESANTVNKFLAR